MLQPANKSDRKPRRIRGQRSWWSLAERGSVKSASMLSYIRDSTSYLGSTEGVSDSLGLAVTPKAKVPET